MKFMCKIASLLLLVSSFSIFALDTCDIEKKTVVIYSNGMFNNDRNINNSEIALENFVNKLIDNGSITLEEGENVDFDVARNVNLSVLSQISDVIRQKLNFSYFQFKMFMGNILKIPFTKDDEEWLLLTKELAELEKTVNNDIVDKMVTLYEKYLNDGYRIIIVAHSQGNMYANAAYAKIVSASKGSAFENAISIVSIGSPIDTVARGAMPDLKKPHATASQDIYMWGVRIATLGSNGLPTFGYENETEDFMGHSFVNAYLYDKRSKTYISNSLKWAFENTEFPHTAKSTEVIRFELTKPNSQISMFVHEEYDTGEYIPVEYFSGKNKSYVEENLVSEYSNVIYGMGEYTSTGMKDTYVLRCSSLEALNQHDNTTVNVTAYIANDSDEYQPVRLEVYDIQNAGGSYIEFESYPHNMLYDYITSSNIIADVNYVNFGGNDHFIHGLNRFIDGYQNGELYKLENKINSK